MKHILWAVTAALLVWTGGGVAIAQITIHPDIAARVAERSATTTAANQRVSALLAQAMNDPALVSARSPDAFAAAVEARSTALVAARAELARLRQELEVLPLIANPDNLDLVTSTNQSVASLVNLIGRCDRILQAILSVPTAVRARDQAAFNAAISTIGSGSVLLSEAQADAMRAQAYLQQEDWPSRSQFLVLACMNDAQAGIALATSVQNSQSEATRRMEIAETCMRQQIDRGRSTITTDNPLRARLAPLDMALFDAMEDGLTCVTGARETVLRNESSGRVAAAFNACYGPVGARINSLSADQNRVLMDSAR